MEKQGLWSIRLQNVCISLVLAGSSAHCIQMALHRNEYFGYEILLPKSMVKMDTIPDQIKRLSPIPEAVFEASQDDRMVVVAAYDFRDRIDSAVVSDCRKDWKVFAERYRTGFEMKVPPTLIKNRDGGSGMLMQARYDPGVIETRVNFAAPVRGLTLQYIYAPERAATVDRVVAESYRSFRYLTPMEMCREMICYRESLYTFQFMVPHSMTKGNGEASLRSGGGLLFENSLMQLEIYPMNPVSFDELLSTEASFQQETIAGRRALVHESTYARVPSSPESISTFTVWFDADGHCLGLGYTVPSRLRSELLTVVQSSYRTLAFDSGFGLSHYSNTALGIEMDVPSGLSPADSFWNRGWRALDVRDLQGRPDLRFEVRVLAAPTSSGRAPSLSDWFGNAEKQFRREWPGVTHRTTTGPNRLRLGEDSAIIFCQTGTAPSLGSRFYTVRVLIPHKDYAVALSYQYADSTRSGTLLPIIERSYQSIRWREPARAGAATVEWKRLGTDRLFAAYHRALRTVFDHYSWSTLALASVERYVRELGGLRIDFRDGSEAARRIAGDDTTEAWKMFLNVFHPCNEAIWYPPDSARSEPAIGETSSILSKTITQCVWRTLRKDFGSRGTVACHSNLSSTMTVAEIAGEIEFWTYLRCSGVPDDSLRRMSRATHRGYSGLARELLGVEVTESLPQFCTEEADMSLQQRLSAVSLAVDWLRAESLALAGKPGRIDIDIYLHRDDSTFRAAGGTERSFVDGYNQKYAVHAKFPRSALTRQTREFRLHLAGALLDDQEASEYAMANPIPYESVRVSFTRIVAHELDHALFGSDTLPTWFAEGQAAYTGEVTGKLASSYSRSGIFESPVARNDAATIDATISAARLLKRTQYLIDSLGLSQSGEVSLDDILRISAQSPAIGLELAKGVEARRKLVDRHADYMSKPTPRESLYTSIVRARPSLARDFKNLVLTPDRLFAKPPRDTLNYALSWALYRSVYRARQLKNPNAGDQWADWRALCRASIFERQRRVQQGDFDRFFALAAEQVNLW
jgi:hypothetical protein